MRHLLLAQKLSRPLVIRRTRLLYNPVSLRYLGINLDRRLSWHTHPLCVDQKTKQRFQALYLFLSSWNRVSETHCRHVGFAVGASADGYLCDRDPWMELLATAPVSTGPRPKVDHQSSLSIQTIKRSLNAIVKITSRKFYRGRTRFQATSRPLHSASADSWNRPRTSLQPA